MPVIIKKVPYKEINDRLKGEIEEEDGSFYSLYKNGILMGYSRYLNMHNESCELGVYIYPAMRKLITKQFIIEVVVNYPKSLGYTQIFIPAEQNSVVKLCTSMRKYGFKFYTIFKNIVWFRKDLI